MKIGVISDTHIPDRSPVLPARIAELFKGLDIILHVGDITELHVLKEFQEAYTLTFAVAGEGDNPEVHEYLEQKRVVRFGERFVVNTHFPPYPSPAFANLAEGFRLLGDADERRLYSVTLAGTNRCPFKCWHCYSVMIFPARPARLVWVWTDC